MHPRTRRLGALGLALLLQVFVLSGFIHPCCLGDGMGHGHGTHSGEAATGGSHAQSDAPLPDEGGRPEQGTEVYGGGHEMGHLAEVDRPEADHPEMGHEDADYDGHASMPVQHPGEADHAEHEAGHAEHQDHRSCGGCEGTCGLCCQTAGVSFLPGPIPIIEGGDDPLRAVRPARMGVAVLPAPPAFLLPFANAPPSPATVSI